MAWSSRVPLGHPTPRAHISPDTAPRNDANVWNWHLSDLPTQRLKVRSSAQSGHAKRTCERCSVSSPSDPKPAAEQTFESRGIRLGVEVDPFASVVAAPDHQLKPTVRQLIEHCHILGEPQGMSESDDRRSETDTDRRSSHNRLPHASTGSSTDKVSARHRSNSS